MDRFVFPRSFYESIRTFKPSVREVLYSAIFGFIFDDAEPELNSVELQRMWMLIYPILSKAKKISNTMSRQSREILERNSRDTDENVGTNSRASSFKEKDKDKERDKDKEKEISPRKEKDKEKSAVASRFSKPTVDQIREYISEKGYHFDAESFFAFYESKGWRVGNTPMKSWQAACVTWEKRVVHTEPHEEVKKEIPEIRQCPHCYSNEIQQRLNYAICSHCGEGFEWTGDRWEIQR